MQVRRWLVPLVVSVAVLALLAGIGLGVTRGGGTQFAGRPHGAGSPGPTGSPTGFAPATPVPPTSGPSGLDARGVRLSGYTAHGTKLTVSYATGLPSCTGHVQPPQVVETDSSVTVTLRLLPVTSKPHVACPDFEEVKTADITLSRPLDGRVVRDGSNGGAPVPRGVPGMVAK